MLEGVTTDNASAVVATARALSRADVSASWVATAEARSQRLPLALPDSHQAAELKSMCWKCKTNVLVCHKSPVGTLVFKMRMHVKTN